MRIFCELCRNTSIEQNVRAYYMLGHRIRDLLFHLKKSRQNLVFPVLRPENLWNLDFAVQYIILLCNTVTYFARSLDLDLKWRKSGRIKAVIPKLVNHVQTGFLKGRFIGGNIRLIDSIIIYTSQQNIPGLLLFIDFEKAFDSLEWSLFYTGELRPRVLF